MKIKNAISRAVYDSNGKPTLEVEITTEEGKSERAIAAGINESNQLDFLCLQNKSELPSLHAVDPAIKAFNNIVRPAILAENCLDQKSIDGILDDLDCTKRKERIGIYNVLATSMAVAKVAARSRNIPLYQHLSSFNEKNKKPRTLQPIFNIIDGANHIQSGIPLLEFLLLPATEIKLAVALEMGSRILYKTRELLWQKGNISGFGEQGGILASLKNCEEAFELIIDAAESLGYEARKDYYLGIDVGTNRFLANGNYLFEWDGSKGMSASSLLELYLKWVNNYPIAYIEDPFTNNDQLYWHTLYQLSSEKIMIVGDDLYSSSLECISSLHERKLTNAFLIKPNRIGTVTKILDTLLKAQNFGLNSIVSHRTSENDDAFLTDIAFAANANFLKAGGMSRMDRIVKYNQLLRLEI
jgi:enolase